MNCRYKRIQSWLILSNLPALVKDTVMDYLRYRTVLAPAWWDWGKPQESLDTQSPGCLNPGSPEYKARMLTTVQCC